MANFPALYHSDDVYRNYQPRIAEFAAAGAQTGLKPAAGDQIRRALIGIDYQEDFVNPSGALSVPGAQDDVRRFVEFLYKNAEDISSLILTLDSHEIFHIAHPIWWEDPATGRLPDPFTVITYQSIKDNQWRARIDPVWSHEYIKLLEREGKKAHVIWPYHVIIGSWGHNLVPALAEAAAWFSAARLSQVIKLTKGEVPQVERFGAFGPQINYPKHPRGGTDTQILDTIGRYHQTFWGGEADEYCVLETQRQAVDYFADRQPEALEGMFFLMDCTSQIGNVPESVQDAYNFRMNAAQQHGVRLIQSTDPIA